MHMMGCIYRIAAKVLVYIVREDTEGRLKLYTVLGGDIAVCLRQPSRNQRCRRGTFYTSAIRWLSILVVFNCRRRSRFALGGHLNMNNIRNVALAFDDI